MNSSDSVFFVTDYNHSVISKENRHTKWKLANSSILHSVVMLAIVFSSIATFLLANNTGLLVLSKRGRVYHIHSASRTYLGQKAEIAGLTPQNLWRLYNLPGSNGGEGQTIAEVIDGDIPSVESDLNAYSQRFGLPACTIASGCLSIQYQGGQQIAKGEDPTEGILDVEIMHAVAPKAHILLYIMQPDFVHITTGPGDIMQIPGLRAINMSYGFDGDGKAFEGIYANNPHNVALFAASGDDGNGVITPPSIYPEVIAVGGTVLEGTTESAWDGSGGGLTSIYAEPAYQKTYGIPNANGQRGNPDIAAVAGTPIVIYDRGQWITVTGTSEASPIWTGIAALVNKPITNDLLYSLAKSKPDSFNDITTGTNGTCGFICTAHPGYNYITGLGTPKNFIANVNALP
jgi:subtilase family serine protease